MTFKFTLLRRTCKQVAALLVAREDRFLNLPDTVALQLHLLACKACPKFESQMRTMRLAMKQWRNYAEEASNQPADAAKMPR